MIKKILFLLTLILSLFVTYAEAGRKAIVIQSVSLAPFESAFEGFNNSCRCDSKRIVLSEFDTNEIPDLISQEKPDVIISIGSSSLGKVLSIKKTPVIYLLVSDKYPVLSPSSNIIGIDMTITPQKQIEAFIKALPLMKNIGTIFNPDKLELPTKIIKKRSTGPETNIIKEYIDSPTAVPMALEKLREKKIEAFWMLPDLTVFTPDTIRHLLLFSIEEQIPILTFSKKYLLLGAMMSVDFDENAMGVQAADIAEQIFSGKDIKEMKTVPAKAMIISVNRIIAQKLGITIDTTNDHNIPVRYLY